MRVLFMGTPDFAVSALEALIAAGHEICGVYTRQDTPKNRGMKMMPPPVKVTALTHEIPVFQPKTLRDPQVQEELIALKPDVAVVAAYGRILPKEVLEAPKYGCLNIHASLLPKYRGASPINAAVLHGDAETGVTIMQMDEGLDTGDMLIKRSIAITENEPVGSVHDRLAVIGGEAIVEALRLLEEKGELIGEKQPEGCDSYAKMIRTEDCAVAFNDDAFSVSCKIRAYDPFPGAYAFLGDEKLKLFAAKRTDVSGKGEPGTILRCDKTGLYVLCRNGEAVCIGEVQGAGGKRMAADAFFRGHAKLLTCSFSK